MSCRPTGAYFAAVTRWPAADELDRPKPFWPADPAAGAAAADAEEDAAGASASEPPAAEEDELAPEQPARAAPLMRIRQGTAAAPSRRRRERREEREEDDAENEEREETACLVRMPLGRRRRVARLRRQVTIWPHTARRSRDVPAGRGEAPRR
jgi:hypothetical protein